MAKPKTLKTYIDDAGRARSDLNIFYGVIALLEGGTISAESHAPAERIIAICRSASAKCLRRMDDNIADATRRFGADSSKAPETNR